MQARRILILGGTTEAREAADGLQTAGHHVVFSLAGVTVSPLLPQTNLRRGGFGGVDGLTRYLREEHIEAVLDATHPFAAIMSRQVFDACRETGTILGRLERPEWKRQSGDRWVSVTSLMEAAGALPSGARVLLTTGRKDIKPFIARLDISGLIRTIEPPDGHLPSQWRLLQDRPPYDLANERDLLESHGITHLVSKNSGGISTHAKLEAARELGLPVVMVERPLKPQCRLFSGVNELLEQSAQWLGSAVAKP